MRATTPGPSIFGRLRASLGISGHLLVSAQGTQQRAVALRACSLWGEIKKTITDIANLAKNHTLVAAGTLATCLFDCSASFKNSVNRRITRRAAGCSATLSGMSTPESHLPSAAQTVVRQAQPTESYNPSAKQRAAAKLSRIPVKIETHESLRKPEWIRVRAGSPSTRFYEIKDILRRNKLVTVCEEASCPNIGECFGKGTATFMIMGDKCTRRCPFCDVGHGRPDPLDPQEPEKLAQTVAALKLKYVVITSVDRDDLRDGGAQHYADCIRQIRTLSPLTQIEILVPDFRGRDDKALAILQSAPPDVMNHNLETVPRLYKQARPGADYAFSLNLLKKFKALFPHIPTKSGLMVGLGETDEEILAVMRDMRAHNIDMLTIGQYLAPSASHLPVKRYVHPDTFRMFEEKAREMGFSHAAVGALVRSSYHADQQAHAAGIR